MLIFLYNIFFICIIDKKLFLGRKMSKEFLLKPTDTKSESGNDYAEITKFSDFFKYVDAKGKYHYYGYCTTCGLKVFWTKPKTVKGDYFFRHVKGFYSKHEQTRMLNCPNYKPSKGKDGEPTPIDEDFLNEIFLFLKNNAYWVFKYINSHILQNKAVMSTDFFISQIQYIFVNHVANLTTSDYILERTLPYNLLSLIFSYGKIDYTALEPKTINIQKLKLFLKEEHNITYFNFIRFSITRNNEEAFLKLEIIQDQDHNVRLERPKTLYYEIFSFDGNMFFEYLYKNKKYENNYLLEDNEIKQKYPKNSEFILQNKNRFLKIQNAIKTFFP